jgi:hypothetical protein
VRKGFRTRVRFPAPPQSFHVLSEFETIQKDDSVKEEPASPTLAAPCVTALQSEEARDGLAEGSTATLDVVDVLSLEPPASLLKEIEGYTRAIEALLGVGAVTAAQGVVRKLRARVEEEARRAS